MNGSFSREFYNLSLRRDHLITVYFTCNVVRKLETTLVTTLQCKMNANLSRHRFWPCHENGLIKMIQTIPHNLYLSVKMTSLYCGLRIILVYPNPQ